jgi:hypothetical protein
VTLNTSQSFDPDNSSSRLNYTWECPRPINETICKRMQNGVRNNFLTIPLWVKLAVGLKGNEDYTFTVTINNLDNPFA